MRKFLKLGDDVVEVSFQFERYINLLNIYIVYFNHEFKDDHLSREDAVKLGYKFNNLVPLMEVMQEEVKKIRDMFKRILDTYELEGDMESHLS